MAYATGASSATGVLLSEPAPCGGFALGASLQADFQKELLMRIYSTENSEEPRHTVTNVDNQVFTKARPVIFAVTNRHITRHKGPPARRNALAPPFPAYPG